MTCTVCLDLGQQLCRLSFLEVKAYSLSRLVGMSHGLRQVDIKYKENLLRYSILTRCSKWGKFLWGLSE